MVRFYTFNYKILRFSFKVYLEFYIISRVNCFGPVDIFLQIWSQI